MSIHEVDIRNIARDHAHQLFAGELERLKSRGFKAIAAIDEESLPYGRGRDAELLKGEAKALVVGNGGSFGGREAATYEVALHEAFIGIHTGIRTIFRDGEGQGPLPISDTIEAVRAPLESEINK